MCFRNCALFFWQYELIGSTVRYQALALEARDIWLEWTKTIRQIPPSELPPGVNPKDKLIDFCGCYFLADGPSMQASFADSLESAKKHAPESRELQFIKVTTIKR